MKILSLCPPLALIVLMISCTKADPIGPVNPPVSTAPYFPPVSGNAWENSTPASLGWNETALNNLYQYLQQKNTKAFIICKNGRIVSEKYFGTFTADSIWYWASAGKTMTAMVVGKAQEEGLLSISDKTSRYLGPGWTSLPSVKEDLITVRHQLTMTTGLDDGVADSDCTLPACLQFKSDPGNRWAYHNAPYTLLDKVVEAATGKSFSAYFQEKIRDRIGMNGGWFRSGFNNVYASNARSMARFGLLLMNKGKWDQTRIISDTAYWQNQVSSSQNINPSYGYLTWLNGKTSFMLPTVQTVFPGTIIPNAPADLFAALGKNDQKVYMVPSQQLVVIRMGESSGDILLAVSGFDNELWGYMKKVIGY